MGKLIVFNSISLDGYFVDAKGEMSWAHNRKPDPEWDAFVGGNASGGGILLFGRVTYDMMASYWPTPMAAKNSPGVAEHMNALEKVVFSRTMEKAAWNNTRLVKGDMVGEMRKLKRDSAKGMVILGSGSIVAQLANERVIDEYQFVVVPVVLGGGRTMFDNVREKIQLELVMSRAFVNGNVVLHYKPVM